MWKHTLDPVARVVFSIFLIKAFSAVFRRIMPWSASQQTSLGYEKQLLKEYFRGNRVTWIDPTGETRVEIRVTCSICETFTSLKQLEVAWLYCTIMLSFCNV